jgi:hypothetical protein
MRRCPPSPLLAAGAAGLLTILVSGGLADPAASIKIAIDRYITQRQLAGLDTSRRCT